MDPTAGPRSSRSSTPASSTTSAVHGRRTGKTTSRRAGRNRRKNRSVRLQPDRRTSEMAMKISLVTGLIALLTAPALAHHSFAMYDMTQTKSATGRLIRFVPGANHAQLHFELIDADGK